MVLWMVIGFLQLVAYLAAVVYIGSLVIRALRKYLREKESNKS